MEQYLKAYQSLTFMINILRTNPKMFWPMMNLKFGYDVKSVVWNKMITFTLWVIWIAIEIFIYSIIYNDLFVFRKK